MLSIYNETSFMSKKHITSVKMYAADDEGISWLQKRDFKQELNCNDKRDH